MMVLISIHLIAFLIFAFMKAIYFFQYSDKDAALALFYENSLSWVSLPAEGTRLLARPWTFITHMFVHDGVWHVLANMLWLGLFGSVLQGLTGNRKLVPVFIYGGLAGAVAFILSYNFLPGLKAGVGVSTLLGASSGVMAVAVVTTFISPGYRIFPMLRGGIPLWVITALYLGIDLATIPTNNPGVFLAHLGGAFTGVLYIYFLRRGYDWSNWMYHFFEWVGNLFNPDRLRKGEKIKDELFYKSSLRPFKKTSNITQQRLDEILDKISRKGCEFLTDDEKEMLKRAGEEEL